MDDGRNLDQVAAKPVHDPIVPEDELTEILPAVLRNDAPGSWEILQPLDVRDDALDKQAGVVGRIPGNEFRDGVEVTERGGRPDYLSHF